MGRTFERWASAAFFIKGPRYMMIYVDLAKQRSQVSGPGTGDGIVWADTNELFCRFHLLFVLYCSAAGPDQVVYHFPSAAAQEGSLACRSQSRMCLQSSWEARNPSQSGVTLKMPGCFPLLWYGESIEWLSNKAKPCGEAGKCIIRTCYWWECC